MDGNHQYRSKKYADYYHPSLSNRGKVHLHRRHERNGGFETAQGKELAPVRLRMQRVWPRLRGPLLKVVHGIHRQYQKGRKRAAGMTLLIAVLVLVLLASVLLPIVGGVVTNGRYVLGPATENLTGRSTPYLLDKLSFDVRDQTFRFNQSGIKQGQENNPIAQLKAQVGGADKNSKSLYSVDAPVDLSRGITYYDNNLNLSFKLVPQFATLPGREEQGKLVYPLANGGQLIYSFRPNGLREDIVLERAPSTGRLALSYKLSLPDTLQAKLVTGTGEIGVYSADPALFGNISYGSNKDQSSVEQARIRSAKTYLVFVMPPPTIIQGDNTSASDLVHFTLRGNTLGIASQNMSRLSYPLTVDPSVVVTSSSDFSLNGNNEGNISFPSNQISRGALNGGSVSGGWSSAGTGFTTARDGPGTVAYNGYLYIFGGENGPTNTVDYNDVQYAPINANGTIGSWNTAASFNTARDTFGYAVYNGYLYILGGEQPNGSGGYNLFNDVQYAKISSNGSLVNNLSSCPGGGTLTNSAWCTTTSFTTARNGQAAIAYNGYMYISGGYNGSAYLNDVQYAPINANGTIGSWNSTSTFTNARTLLHIETYNGYFYVMFGYSFTTGNNYWADVQYAPINANGTLGTFVSTTSVATGRSAPGVILANGYVYVMGGYNGSFLQDTWYAPINANGTIGKWTSTSNFTAPARDAMGTVAYNGYLYMTGGHSGTSSGDCTVAGAGGGDECNGVQYAALDAAGIATAYTTSGNAFTTTRNGVEEVAYNGHLYVLGGYNGTNAPVATVYQATINGDGTIGTFAATTSFTTARAWFGAVAYNGYMYVIGGCSSANASCTTTTNDVATVYKAPINTDGTIGTWTNTNMASLTTGIYGLAAIAYNGYMYVVGGINGSTLRTAIYYHAISTTDGSMSAAWSTSARTLSAATAYMGLTAYAGNVYIAGGCTAGALTCTSVVNNVYYATCGSGDLGALTGTTAFTTARGQLGLVASNSYLYVMGGWNGTTYYSDTQYIKIKTNGSLDTSWSTASGSTLSSTRRGFGAVAYNGYIYVAGGYNGTTYYTDVQYAQVNNGGQGTTASWATTTNLPTTARGFFPSVAYNGYVYALGGYNGTTYLNDVQYAPLNANGTIGTWASTHSFTTAREDFAATVYNGYIYLMGGNAGAGATRMGDVQYALICTGNNSGTGGCTSTAGTVGTWSSTSSMIVARSGLAAVANAGYMYIVAGEGVSASGDCNGTNDNFCSGVQYAPINANGTIGTWHFTHASTDDSTTFVSGFTTGRNDPAAKVYNGYLYVFGGYNGDSNTYFNDVQYAPLNANGTIGTWAYTTSFNTGRDGPGAAVYNGYIYISGGSESWSDVQYAPINANGTIGNWMGTAAQTASHTYSGSVVYNGYMYALGGMNNSSVPIQTTEYAQLNSIPRIGNYSKLLDLGTAQLSSISYAGTVPGGLGQFSYKMGANGTGVFGSVSSASSLSGTSVACPASPGRYVWLSIELDDTQDGGFPDVDGADANITDTTLNYTTRHAPPNLRLRGGAFFSANILQPLDVCGP